MRLRAIPSLLCIVSMVASGASPQAEVTPVSYGILEPESAAVLMATAQRAAGVQKIDMSSFSYSGPDRFNKVEQAWMATERVRQPDGSDLWTDIICSTYSKGKYGPWRCSSDEERTVAVDGIGAERILEFTLDDAMSGDQARQIISSALTEMFRTEELGVCDTKHRHPVPGYLVNPENDWRGADGYLKQEGDTFHLTLNFFRIRFSYDATASPQARLLCMDPVEELE